MRESCRGRRVTGDLVKMEVGRRRRESFGARSFCRIQNLPESGLGFGCKTLVIESVGGLAEADFLNWKSFPDFMNSFLLFLLWSPVSTLIMHGSLDMITGLIVMRMSGYVQGFVANKRAYHGIPSRYN
ncbi:unnamed protein product [Vicia faba]|uniref:Uncharacterized protein n=1 Tax=Vicia faba TaxID=3906 RepID=A0AAV0YT71_VICFA|nr:unnamed protein product [Vicia faba]